MVNATGAVRYRVNDTAAASGEWVLLDRLPLSLAAQSFHQQALEMGLQGGCGATVVGSSGALDRFCYQPDMAAAT